MKSKLNARHLMESYGKVFSDIDKEELSLPIEEEFSIVPLKLFKDILFFRINGVAYGYKANDGEDAKELWRKFDKMITQYKAGGKAFQWLKKHATHKLGGKTGNKIPRMS